MKNRFLKYTIIETLVEHECVTLYRAVRNKDGLSVIIKALSPEAHCNYFYAKIEEEYHRLTLCQSPYIVKPIELYERSNDIALILEDIGAQSIDGLLKDKKLTFKNKLFIALELAHAMEVLYQFRIVHNDISPENIVVNFSKKQLQIIDFGHSFEWDIEQSTIKMDNLSTQNLYYCSPEFTGRVNLNVDHRSDLYSVGLTLYHLFSEQLPFNDKDKLSLIHKQVTLMPTSLSALGKSIPKSIDKIITKLIDKSPDKRYQNAKNLRNDLTIVVQAFEQNKQLDIQNVAVSIPLYEPLGTHLLQRDAQLEQIKQKFNHTVAGKNALIRLIGVSGVGKTRLIQESIYYAYTQSMVVFQVKCRQYHNETQFDLIRLLLMNLQERITRSKLDIFDQLKVIVKNYQSTFSHLLPSFVEQFGLTLNHKFMRLEELKQTMTLALEEIIGLFIARKQAMVISIDDIQWIDNSSLQMIHRILLNIGRPYIACMVSLRQEYADAFKRQYPFLFSTHFFEIKLENLDTDAIQGVLKGLFTNINNSHKLAKILYKQTNGNFLFLENRLESLLNKKFIIPTENGYVWDEKALIEKDVDLDVLSLLQDKLNALVAKERLVLQVLALSEYPMGLGFVKTITKLSYPVLKKVVMHLEDIGFINKYRNSFSITHDKIEQAIVKDIGNEKKGLLEVEIGNLFVREQKDDYMLFHGVEILNKNFSSIDKKSRKELLFRATYLAMKKAVSVDSEKAQLLLDYIETNFKKNISWDKHFIKAFEFSLLKVEILYIRRQHEQSEQLIYDLQSKAKSEKQKVQLFSLQKSLNVTMGKNFETNIKIGANLLSELGLMMPKLDNLAMEVNTLFSTISKYDAFENPALILGLGKRKGSDSIDAILVDMWEDGFYLANITLMKWCYLTIIERSFRLGLTGHSSFAFVLLGGYYSANALYKQGYIFGDIAIKLNKQFKDTVTLPKVNNFMANFISPYSKGFSHNHIYYQKSLHQSRMNGDLVFGTWANFLDVFSSFLEGESLDNIESYIETQCDFIEHSGDEKMQNILKILHNSCRRMHTKIHHNELQRLEIEEKAFLQHFEENAFSTGLSWYAIIKAYELLLHNEYAKVLETFSKYLQNESTEIIMFANIALHFIRALAILGLKNENNSLYNDAKGETLAQDIQFFKILARTSPKAYKSYLLLLNAELKSHSNTAWDALKEYDILINRMQAESNTLIKVLTHQRIAQLWKRLGNTNSYEAHLEKRDIFLKRWHGFNVIDCLNHKSVTNSSNQINTAVTFEYMSLVKALSAISTITDAQLLLQTLLRTILEFAVAQKAFLCVVENNIPQLKLGIDFRTDTFITPQKQDDLSKELSLDLINHVQNSQEVLYTNNPFSEGPFYNETLAVNDPSSLLLLPVVIANKVEAILWLEHKDLKEAFRADSIEVLKLLLNQTIISYKNMHFIDNLNILSTNLKNAQEIAHVGNWEYFLEDKKLVWSEETYRIMGLEPFSVPVDFEFFQSFVDPNYLDILLEKSTLSLENNIPYDVTHDIITQKGERKTVHQVGHLRFKDNKVYSQFGTIQDITASSKAKQHLAKLFQTIEQSPVMIGITNIDGILEYVNPAFLSVTQYQPEEILGHKISIIQSGAHSREVYATIWKTIKELKEPWYGELVNKRKDGTTFVQRGSIAPILNEEGNIDSFVTIQSDITQEKEKDRIFLLQSRQAQMGEMLSMIAHQWRQPLASINAIGANLKMRMELGTFEENYGGKELKKLESQVGFLSHTIDDFRNFFKPDKEKDNFLVVDIIEQSLQLIAKSLELQNITVKSGIDATLGITSYKSELVQVFLNLFKNVLDVVKDKKLSNTVITLSSKENKSDIKLFFEDNAGGIPAEVIDKIFLPYFSTKDELQGTGLGLHLSKTIIEEHCKGKIMVENTKVGARFSIELPKG